ncbi:MAG: hypothetical protein ACRC5H_01520 [Treponemataceae bacterium]
MNIEVLNVFLLVIKDFRIIAGLIIVVLYLSFFFYVLNFEKKIMGLKMQEKSEPVQSDAPEEEQVT